MNPVSYNTSMGRGDEEAAIRCKLAATRCKLSICAARAIAYVIHHNFCPEKDFHAFFTEILHAVYGEEPSEIKEKENKFTYHRSLSYVLSAISTPADTCYYMRQVEEHNLQAWFAEHKWTQWLIACSPPYTERSPNPLDSVEKLDVSHCSSVDSPLNIDELDESFDTTDPLDRRAPQRAVNIPPHSSAVSNSNGRKGQSPTMFTSMDTNSRTGEDRVAINKRISNSPGIVFFAIFSHKKLPGSQCTHNRISPQGPVVTSRGISHYPGIDFSAIFSHEKPPESQCKGLNKAPSNDDNSDLEPWKPSQQGPFVIPREMAYEEGMGSEDDENPSC